MRIISLILLLFSIGGKLFSQVLTPDDAIALALKNNYSILVQRNNSEISKNDATYGNAGMLPQVSFNTSATLSNTETKQNLLSGAVIDKKGAQSTNINSGVTLNWVLFDGMKMFATYDKLKETRELSDTRLKIKIENTIATILNNYYALVKQKQLITATENDLKLYEERMKIAETKWKIGSGSKLDYLQAKVDMNGQRSNYLKLKNDFTNFKITMNNLLSLPADKDFDVSDSIAVNYNPVYEDLKTSVVKQNRSLLFQQQNIRISEFTLKETRSAIFPRISFTSNYSFARTQSQAGFILLNQNLGFTGGFIASWNLFNGGNTNRLIKDSQLSILNSKLSFDSTRLGVEVAVLRAYNAFKSAKEILTLEQENFVVAKENVDIALERFRLGSSNSLELKEAQKSFEDAEVRLVNARYDAKIAETELMRLNGALIK